MKELFKNLIETMPLGILVKDAKDDFRYSICNMSASIILGKSTEEIIGKIDSEIFSEDIASLHEQLDYQIIQTKKIEQNKVLIDFGYGGIWLRSTQYPLLDESGSIYAVMRILENITDAVKLEQKLHHFQKMEEVGKLAGGVAHEFNNLLQVIVGYSDLIEEETTEENTTNNVSQILKATKSAQSLTRQLLTFSRKTGLRKEIIDANLLVENSISMLKMVFDENINLEIQNSKTEANVEVDSGQIEQILINLCVNSRDAMGGNGKINIKVSVVTEVWEAITLAIRKNINQSFVKIEFSDNGPGIPEEIQAHIFEPFFTTKDVGKGTGLGLATVYAILKQHNSYIFLDSDREKGTKFNIYIPVFTGNNIQQNIDNIQTQLLSSIDGNKKTVIVAEDEDAVKKMCVKLLRKNGFRVLEASNGKEALELYEKNTGKVSLLLFDIMMPEMTGKEAYDIISAKEPNIPTLFCTGYSSDLIPNDVVDRPSVQLLTKPYRSTALIKSITELLSDEANTNTVEN